MKNNLFQKIIDKIRGKKNKKILNNKNVKKWFADDGDTTLRLNYNLNNNSIIFDVGGYHGNFTEDILAKYNCYSHIFEPIQELFQIIEKKFKLNTKIKVNHFGLSGKTQNVIMGLEDNASTIYAQKNDKKEEVKFVDIMEYISDNKITSIDLIKINIEGGEYELLERLIEIDFIKNIKNIQVQFHNMSEDSEIRMKKIQEALSKTHKLTYQYEWCWENWELL